MCLGNDSCILHYKENTDAVIGGSDIFLQSCAFKVPLPSLVKHLGSLQVLVNTVIIFKKWIAGVVSASEGLVLLDVRLQLAGQSRFS